MRMRDYRGIDEVEVTLAPVGITIIQGPNEVGKSSLAEAIDMLIRHPDSSKRDEIRSLQPVGRDVGPYVEADIESGHHRFTYAKQWLRQPSTTLTITAPAPAHHTGREAHEAVEGILAGSADLHLFRALWLRQGDALVGSAPGVGGTLGEALDAAASAGTTAGDDGDALVTAIKEERSRWYTETGREKQALTDLRDALAAAADDDAAARLDLAALAASVADLERLRRELAAADAVEPARRSSVADLERDLDAATVSASHAREAAQAADAAGARADLAVSAVGVRRRQVAEITADEQRLGALRDEAAGAGERLAAVAERRDAARVALDAAAAALALAQAAFELADRDDTHLRDLFDHTQLRQRRTRVAEADRLIADGEAFLAACRVDDVLMRRIEAAAEESAEARGRREAGAMRVRVTAEAEVRLEFEGATHDLAAGEVADLAPPPGAGMRIPGVARIEFADPLARDPASDDPGAALAALLREAGVGADPEGVATARDLLRRRGEEEARVHAARGSRAADLDDLTPDEMDGKITRADERITTYREARSADVPLPVDREATKRVRAEAESAAAAAREVVERTRGDHDAAEAVLRNADMEQAGRSERTTLVEERVAAARLVLEAARAETSDEGIERAADEASCAAGEARAVAQAAATASGQADAVSVTARLGNARKALSRLDAERGDARVAIATLEATVERDGDLGLAGRVSSTEAAVEHARTDLAAADRRARAVALLHEVVMRHRDEAHRAYVAPYRAEVERLARGVFGPGISVDVAHEDLGIISRTLNGRTLRLADLSGGAREQLAIIGRLAAAGIAAGTDGGDGAVPVIMDDVLGFTDASRLEGLGAALVAAGERTQVIVLTCAPERYAAIGSATTVRMEPRGR